MKSRFFVLSLLSVIILCTYASQPVGTLQRDTIQGVPCVVYLPYNYAERAEKGTNFPCLYLQHGMFGSENDWTQQGHLLHWMDSLLREDMIAEMVVVMPDNFLGSIPPAERRR